MSSLPNSANCSTSSSACRISPEQINKVRPKLALLKILQAAGAQGEMFTVKEVMHFLGQYIMVKQLYDKQEQHMVYCGGDLLGELLGRQSFSVKDPSPLYDMLRKNLVTLATATTEGDSSSNFRERTEENNTSVLLPSKHKCRPSAEGDDLIGNLSHDETSNLDLGFEEWDVAGLPWWFIGNLRNNYTPRSNGSTDLQTNQDVGTAVVSDITDDLFLNESLSEQFGVGIKVEAADTEQSEVGKVRDKKVIEVGKNDDFEDSKSIDDETDVEVTSEDEWQCTECKKFNSPSKRYCFRCWALRKDWYSDCSKLTHSLSTSDITAIPEKKEDEGIDVPDCRRTVSAPVVRPKDVYIKEENSKLFDSCHSVEFLNLAHSSESQETISSMGEQPDSLFEQKTYTDNMEDCQNLLKPCSLCEKRPRDGNIIHGRTGHLVTCFHCARRLKKTGASCPICKKEIQFVSKVFIA